jgi:hypothetical protein
MDRQEQLAKLFESHRTHLRAVAYRIIRPELIVRRVTVSGFDFPIRFISGGRK